MNLQLISHTQARPQTLTQDVPFSSAAISSHQTEHMTRCDTYSIHRCSQAKFILPSSKEMCCSEVQIKFKITSNALHYKY
jgi:hypothetical protein